MTGIGFKIPKWTYEVPHFMDRQFYRALSEKVFIQRNTVTLIDLLKTKPQESLKIKLAKSMVSFSLTSLSGLEKEKFVIAT